MKYILYVITALYAVLSAIAAIVQMKTSKENSTSFIMLGGSVVLIITVILHILSIPFSWIGAVIGGLLICTAAFLNGKRSGNFHIIHHIIRLIITVLLTVGYILL